MARIVKKEEATIVWSSDGSHLKPKEKEELPPLVPKEHTIKLRLEKNARGGKLVSVLFELPAHEEYFKAFFKKLKKYCGAGGTYKEGKIEIQGDQRKKIKTFSEEEGFKVVLAGG